jgi:hypothetical protein
MIAAPLEPAARPAPTASSSPPARRSGGRVRTECAVAAAGLGARGWDVEIDNRPERAKARACVACGGDHR